MPYVVGADGREWIFATRTKTWVPPSGNDSWNAVYPNYRGWWQDFADLPELPEGAIPA
jgi:hypothetical protein